MRLVPITAGEVSGVWSDLEPMFQSFADRSNGRHTIGHFREAVASRRMQCWTAQDDGIRAVALTEVLSDDTDTVFLLAGAGSKAGDWVFLVDGIKQWARERGSRKFIAEARPGWERYFKNHGFKKTHVILEADL